MPEEKKVTLNEKTMTQTEFDQKKEELEKKPGVTVVQVNEDTFKSRIKG